MAEEVKEEEVTEQAPEFNAVEELKKIKENTVSKDKYEQLDKQYAQLFQAYANGESFGGPAVEEEKVDLGKLRDDLFNKESDNLTYVKNTLKLRDELIKRGEKDPFLAYGKQIMPEDNDFAIADRVAKELKECVDIADGNSQIFTNELQRRLVDVTPYMRK